MNFLKKIKHGRSICIPSLRAIICAALLTLSGTTVFAQIATTISGGTIAAGTYTSFANAVTALNAAAITGPVTVNLNAGGTETLSSAIEITVTGTSTAPILFQKSGTGNNPILLGNMAGLTTQAIFVLQGSDYVTIDGINLDGAGTNNGYGFYLAKASTTNGCQFNTIKNCTVSLNITIATVTQGMYSGAAPYVTATGVGTNTTATSFAGTNSSNVFKSNTIKNVIHGITLASTATTAGVRDSANTIGGPNTTDGNIITFGSPNYPVSSASNGIIEVWNYGVTIQNNLIRNDDGSNTNTSPSAANRGIFLNLSSPGSSATVANNTISLKSSNNQSSSSPTETNAIVGIMCQMSNDTAAGAKISIINNIISGQCGAGTVPFMGIAYNSKVDTLNISNNEITGYSSNVTTRPFYGISGFGTAPTSAHNGYLKINNNNIHDITFTSTGALVMLSVYSSYNGFEITGNTIANISRPTGGTASTENDLINTQSSYGSGNSKITNNYIHDISLATGHLYGIYARPNVASLLTFTGNTFKNLSTSGASNLAGFYTSTSASNFLTGSTISNNAMTNFAGGSQANSGIYYIASCPNITIANNKIDSLSGSPLSGYYVTAIYTQPSNTNIVNINNNKLTRMILTSGATISNAAGIWTGTSNNIYNIYNNYIADLRAPSASPLSTVPGGVTGIGLNGLGTNNVYYNTIYPSSNGLLTSSGSNFGASGIFYMPACVLTDIKNNIINIQGTPASKGTIVAVRRYALNTANTPPANLILKNNILYVNPGANNWLYAEGTNNVTDSLRNGFATSGVTASANNNLVQDLNFNMPCSAFKNFMNGNGTSTFTENILTQNADTTFAPTGASLAEGNAINITNPAISTDFYGAARSSFADIGAIEFSGTSIDMSGPGIAFTPLPNQNCNNTPILKAIISDPSGINTVIGTKPRLYFKRAVDANTFANWKYTEGVNTSGNNYSFTLDYSLLATPPAVGDSLHYFVVAQDLSASAYTSFYAAVPATGYCPSSVNLTASAFPVTAYNSFALRSPVSSNITATSINVCPGMPDTIYTELTRVDKTNIGTQASTTTSISPFYYNPSFGRKTQIIWTAAELRAFGLRKGNITALTFKTSAVAASLPTANITIKIDSTTTTNLTTSAFATSPANTIYTNAAYQVLLGDNKFIFSTPFNWNGFSNVIVEFCQSTAGVTASAPTVYYTSSGTGNNRLAYYSSSANPCAGTAAPATATSSRLDLTFDGNIDAGDTYNNFVWNDGTSNVGTSNDSLIITPPFSSGNTMNYSVVADDGFGCTLNANININKLTNPIVLNPSSTSNTCGGAAIQLNAGTAVTWSPATNLFSENTATTPYANTPLSSVYAKLNNNHYVVATYTSGSCMFKDSVLVSVPNINGSTSIANNTGAADIDSIVINGNSNMHNADCELMATIAPFGINPVAGLVRGKVTYDASIQTTSIGAPFVTRHVEISPAINAGTSMATVTLYYTQTDFDQYNTYVTTNNLTSLYPLMPANPSGSTSAIKLTKFEGAGATPASNTGATLVPVNSVNWNSTTGLWEISFNVSGFSTFYLHTNLSNTPLPINFANFNAVAQNQNNKLTWNMGDARNNGTFEILHSNDGRNYTSLGSIKSVTENEYTFVHNLPASIEIYQIRFIDEHNKSYYSSPKMVERDNAKMPGLILYPSPVFDNSLRANITNSNSELQYTIYDALGRAVLKGNIANNQKGDLTTTINIESLSNGIYHFNLIANGQSLVKKFVVAGK